MKKNILFLDFDGVFRDVGDLLFSHSLEIIKQLISDYDLWVVPISSSIGLGTNNRKRRISSYLNSLGIYKIDGYIDVFFEGNYYNTALSSRTLGIVNYLLQNNDCSYVIFDDEYDFEYDLLNLNYVKTSSDVGLTDSDLYNFKLEGADINNLKSVVYKYRDISKYDYLRYSNDLVNVLKKVYYKKISE